MRDEVHAIVLRAVSQYADSAYCPTGPFRLLELLGVSITYLLAMAKSRQKIQQLGFWDAELSSPDHDAVCLWAYDNADFIVRAACPDIFDRSWKDQDVSYSFLRNDPSALDLAREFKTATPRPNPRVSRKTLEYVLRSYTGYQDKLERIVGYADLLIETEVPIVTAKYAPGPTRYDDDVFDGFEMTWSRGREAPYILVEAKSVLPTVGELMRQIQLYRTAFGGKMVVVSPDDRYASILAEQGVIFVKYIR